MTSKPPDSLETLSADTQRDWHAFVTLYEPLRSDLYRYCRYLTRSPWDAEDLAQDGLARMEARFMLGVQPTPPRAQLLFCRGEPVILSWYAHADGEMVRAVTRADVIDGRISRLRNYFFTPDFIQDVCDELGVPHRSNGHRYWLPKRSTNHGA